MKRLAVVITVSALLLAACGASNQVEATVNGAEITTEDVEGVVYEVTDADREPAQFATYLGLLIQWAAIEQRVDAEVGYQPTEDEIDSQVRSLVLANGIDQLEPFLIQRNISESFLRRLASHVLIEQHLHEQSLPPVEEATLEEAEAALAEAPDDWISEVCASHILVGTVDEAAFAMSRLNAGEDFAVVATELSLDTGSAAVGGSLGCADPSGYVPEFAEATKTTPIGEISEPVETEFGFHLIVVDSRAPATVEEVREALIQERQFEADELAFEEVTAWLSETVKAASVTVEPSRGTWVTEPEPLVQPPAVLE